MFNILVVEDNKDLCELFCTVLTEAGYHSHQAADGMEALEVVGREYIDLIIADIMMPRLNGYELISSLRGKGFDLPILIVTAKEDYDSMQQGFSLGADDYMVKPINVKELLLRVGALLRRSQIISERKITVGSTELNYDSLTMTINGVETTLPQKEFLLLYKMLSYPGKIFTRQQLMDEIWGIDSETDDRTINTHINRLRDRLASCDDFEIVTIRGLGYKVVKTGEK
ncbi:MAG: response regulator transcription factor [Oscillospiraceae bacterium]